MEERTTKKKRKKKGKKLLVILAAVLAVSLAGVGYWRKNGAKEDQETERNIQTAEAVVMDLSSSLTASSSLSPKDTYEVTSLVEGEILEAAFEEGDVVEKDQVLYRIDSSSMDTDLSSAQTSLLRAEEDGQRAGEEYSEALEALSGNTYKAPGAGYIKTLYIKEGDKIANGTKLADLYDDSVMKLTVPFLSKEAEQIVPGSGATVTISDTGEQIGGTVTVVSSLEETLSGGRLVKAVTVEVSNPGGLTALTRATAAVGDFVCGEEGTFVPKTETVLNAELSGQGSLEVEQLLVSEGTYIQDEAALFKATDSSAEKYIRTFKEALDAATDSIQEAKNRLDSAEDTIGDYTITAPISGTVITKNSKAGDKITRGSGENTVMAVIYDLSSMTLSMSVDELDVGKVKVGQQVEITADAAEGQVFTGTVTNVSLEGSYSNGVTNYPVTVTLEETGELLPGMNVDARIILDSAKDALCIPAGALMRGNRVFVKQDDAGAESSAEAGVPEGFVSVQVETGIINDEYVQILSGLSEGAVVYVDPRAGADTEMGVMMMPARMGGPGGPRP